MVRDAPRRVLSLFVVWLVAGCVVHYRLHRDDADEPTGSTTRGGSDEAASTDAAAASDGAGTGCDGPCLHDGVCLDLLCTMADAVDCIDPCEADPAVDGCWFACTMVDQADCWDPDCA